MSITEKSLASLSETLNKFNSEIHKVEKIGEIICQAIKSGNKVLTAGNGGSAADALHLAEELMGRFEKERNPWPAVCLCSDTTLITCIANDYGFKQVFSRQIKGLGKEGDLFIAFSASGNSENLIEAILVAKQLGVKTIALLGKTGGKARGIADFEIIVPSQETARIQEIHTFILHCWLAVAEYKL